MKAIVKDSGGRRFQVLLWSTPVQQTAHINFRSLSGLGNATASEFMAVSATRFQSGTIAAFSASYR
jgi:hypothetical protein